MVSEMVLFCFWGFVKDIDNNPYPFLTENDKHTLFYSLPYIKYTFIVQFHLKLSL